MPVSLSFRFPLIFLCLIFKYCSCTHCLKVPVSVLLASRYSNFYIPVLNLYSLVSSHSFSALSPRKNSLKNYISASYLSSYCVLGSSGNYQPVSIISNSSEYFSFDFLVSSLLNLPLRYLPPRSPRILVISWPFCIVLDSF